MITLTNTLSHTKERFIPHNSGAIKMYVCGITPYAPAHIGHGRCYITFDVLYRLLLFLGYTVTYCRNYTDIDDKLLNKAQQLFGDQLKYPEIAKQVIAQYQNEMNALNCLAPDKEPRVTENIPEIITFIEGLIKKGYAYECNGDVYFRVHTFQEYGKLSGQNVAHMKSGERVELNEYKEDPLDFALWKHEPGNYFWESPWGNGRPGWHIECSALAEKHLGTQIDIHGGGLDLIFPHHENEIAQSESLHGCEFARFWIHNGFVQVNKEKMSKSLGNVHNLCDLFEIVNPIILRYYFLTHQYRMPIDFSPQALHACAKSYERLCHFFTSTQPQPCTKVDLEVYPIANRMLAALCDDLNTPALFGILFESLDELKQNKQESGIVAYLLNTILGLPLKSVEKEIAITPEIERLLNERETARKEKNWKQADVLRDQLKKLGFEVQDKKI